MIIYGQPKSQFIEEALINGIQAETERFFRTKFDNASENHISTFRGQLDKKKMEILKFRVEKIVNEYYTLIDGMILNKEESDLSKEIFIANYILKNVTYSNVQFATGGNVFGGHRYSNSVYGALVYCDAVCTGVSEAVDCLSKVLGVESKKLLVSPSDPFGGGHAYNIVKIGDSWYEIDVTTEIGLIPGRKIRSGKWTDKRFLVPFSEIQRQTSVPYVPDCNKLYPREKIEQMKKRLEQRGLSFNYQIDNNSIRQNRGTNNSSFIVKNVRQLEESTSVDLSYPIEQLNRAKEASDYEMIKFWQKAILSSTKEARRHLEFIDSRLKEALNDEEKNYWNNVLKTLAETQIKNWEKNNKQKLF